MKKYILIILTVLVPGLLTAQTGGSNVYEFLNLTHSAHVSSLGGTNVSMNENINFAYHNPSLLSSGMDRSIALNYVNYFAGINYGLAMYSRSYRRTGNFAAGVTYLNYGTFREADASGVITGNFSATEYAFNLIWSKQLDSSFSFGVNMKPVLSSLEKYTSFGLVFDLGASWRNQSNRFSAGIVIRNAGWQITSYAGEQKENPPFEITAGVTQKLAYAPFRFSLAIRHLEKYDITYDYDEPDKEDTESSEFGGNLLKHIVLGAELIPHKNFYLAAGYNFQRRLELHTESKGSGAGFTWGFGVNTNWMDLEFGRAIYHSAGAATNISLILRPNRIYRKGS
jgi:hypothetical protein